MHQLFGTYDNLIIPAAVALLAVIILVKIAIAIEHAVIRLATSLLTILILGAVLIAGSSIIGRINGIQSAALAAAHSMSATQANGAIQAAVLQKEIAANARTALRSVGLNPAYMHISITCSATGATLHLRYGDTSFLYGLISHQDFSAPLPNNVRCR
jgi:hypothetical protein